MPKAVILTALADEYRAVRAHLSELREQVHPQSTVYQSGRFEANGRTWDIPLVQVGMGNQRAAVETERALSFFGPDVAMFVGIAGGLKDANLGDVVAGTKIYAYEYGKAGEKFLPRPEVGLGSYPLVQRARQVARDDVWQSRIMPPIEGAAPKAVVEPIAAGAQVVASNRASTFRFLRDTYSDAAAVEMEGHGFLEATHATSGVLALVVRGISDMIEDKAQSDSEGWQPKAASHAAAFAFEVLARYQTKEEPVFGGSALPFDLGQVATEVRTTLLPQASPTRARGILPTRVRSFVGRGQELEQIHSILRSDARSEPALVAVHGLSGVGKTQLCREYMEIHRAEYNLTYWISAADHAQATSDLAQLADDLNLTRFDLQDLARSSRAALEWLEHNNNWLLIFDNAAPHSVRSLLPARGLGHILISSNDPNWYSITSNRLRLRGLSPEDAVQFLLQRTGLTDSSAATRIAHAFDYLPLALEQAAAYIETTSIDFDGYEQLLTEHRPELLDERSLFTDYPESVYSALRLNVERVSNSSPDAIMLLNFIAYVNPSGIPRGLVSDAVDNCLYQMDMRFDGLVFNNMVAELSRLSLITAEDDRISTHPLVQAFVRDSLADEGRIAWSKFVLSVLAHTFPDEVEHSSTWPRCESLIDHVTTAIKLADYQSWDDEYIEALYFNAGSYLHVRGRQDQACEILSKALDQSIARLGEDHPQVALASNNLLGVLVALGRSDEALALGKRAIEILTKDQKTQDKYAIDLGKVYSNLGKVSLHSEKDFQAARSNLGRALSIHTSRLGENHYTTAIDINNIGTVYREEGKWAEAYSHFQKAVRIHRAALPSTDYRLAIALYNLGTAAYNLERYVEAWVYLHEAVEINEILQGGAEGWDQMDALFGLGRTLRILGKPRESLPYFDRAIQIGDDLFGRDTPRVKSTTSERGAAAFDVIRPFFCYYTVPR